MRYQFTYRTTAKDLWQLSMYYTYGSMVGVCNVVFTAAVLALAISRWSVAPVWQKVLMVLGICLFTVIQPVLVYSRASRQAAQITEDTTMQFADDGVYIRVGEKTSQLKWSQMKRVSRKPTLIVLFSDSTHGFVLPNRVLGKEKEDFYQYVISKVES
ncbi:MAG: YcxB family protein [Lachnospiraceae bacterium]